MVHFLGHYFDPLVFWAVAPAAVGIVITAIVTTIVYELGPSRRHAKTVANRLDGMQRDMHKMALYLDGLPKSTGPVRLSYDAGMDAMRACEWDEAIGYFRKAMIDAKGTQLVALFNLIGLCHYTPGRLDDALRNYEESVRLAEQFGDKKGRAYALGSLGHIYSVKGEPDKGLKYFEEVLAMAREIGYQHGVASALLSLGHIYSVKGEPDKGLKYCEEGLAMAREIGYQQGVSAALGSLGLIYSYRGRLDRALKYQEEALAVDREIGYQQGVASDLGNIGSIYYSMGEFDEALRHYEESLEIARKVGYQQAVGSDLRNIGSTCYSKGEFDKALKYLAQAILVFSAIGDRPKAEKATGELKPLLGQVGREKFVAGCVEAGMTSADAVKLADSLARPGESSD